MLPICLTHLIPGGLSIIAALHDIGKITPGFLLKARPHWDFPGAKGHSQYEGNHAKVSQAFLASLPAIRKGSKPPDWILAAGGHHGIYPFSRGYTGKIDEDSLEWPESLRQDLLVQLETLFGPIPLIEIPKGPLVHWLTGFITFSDWIGSDTRWFPLTPGPLIDRVDPSAVRVKAAEIIHSLGWHHREVRGGITFTGLFPQLPSVRPLQEALLQAVDSPGLYIVEAPMGIGKTEAALAAAYRRWTEGEERGLYFALPTQLTSNRIHKRVAEFLDPIVADRSFLSLVHANAWMRPDKILSISPTAGAAEDGAADMRDWYASGRKSLLAAFGTGTIDQALMSCLPVKHSGLRLFALAGKVVVMDEVHSYDPYTSALVDQTVAWLLQLRCTVIVLSATLSIARRTSLLKAAGAENEVHHMGYPLISKVATGGGKAECLEITGERLCTNRVHISRIHGNHGALWEDLAQKAEDGACIVIIRNTVALAQETHRLLKHCLRDKGVKTGLLHSRFPQYRRDVNEKEWMEALDREGKKRPQGCILIATQVIEQSVDIDADLLVTDLAPVDLILQRLGRLHRHQRPRPPGFENPQCLVLMPEVDWNSSEKEIKVALGPSGYIYPPFSLYQADRVIANLPESLITLPQDIRALVEESVRIPDSLEPGAAHFHAMLEKEMAEMLGTARLQDVFNSPTTGDVEGKRTRWNNQESALLVLLRRSPGAEASELEFHNGEKARISHGPFNPALALALHRNAIRIPYYLVKDQMNNRPLWLVNHCRDAVLAITPNDSSVCNLVESNGEDRFLLDYQDERGLSYRKNENRKTGVDLEPYEESWF